MRELVGVRAGQVEMVQSVSRELREPPGAVLRCPDEADEITDLLEGILREECAQLLGALPVLGVMQIGIEVQRRDGFGTRLDQLSGHRKLLRSDPRLAQ